MSEVFRRELDFVRFVIQLLVGAVAALVRNLDDVLGAAARVAGFLVGAWSVAIQAATLPIRGVIGVIESLVSHLGDIISLAGRAASALARLSVPGGGIIGTVLGALGHATGGIFDQATLLIAGEAGKEVLLPLNNPARALSLAQESGLFDTLAAAIRAPSFIPSRATGLAASGDTITMNLFFAPGTTPAQANALSRAAVQGVEEEKRRSRARLEARIA
jgi:hypothetical protein